MLIQGASISEKEDEKGAVHWNWQNFCFIK
jgi:hypothetical protein